MKKILILFFAGLFPNLILLSMMFVYDPLQLYHQPFFRDKNLIDTNMRYQAAGIINTWNFDSVVLGTSMLQNTSNIETQNKLDGSWINLSIAAGTLYERNILLQYALKKKHIKKVILSLEPFIFLGNNDTSHFIDYKYLYDDNLFNNFKIYLNEIYLFCMLKISNTCLNVVDPQYPIAWFNNPLFNQTFGGIQNWIKKYDNKIMKENIKNILEPKPKETLSSLEDVYKNLQENLIVTIKKYPNTMFYLFYPPFSTLYYKLNNNKKNWLLWKNGLRFLLEENLENLKIYGFDNENFTNKIERYRDLEHYDEKVNSFMLDAIKNDTHRITLENVDSYFEEMQKKVEAYDIEPLRKQIIESGVLNK